MTAAVMPYARENFITPMAAVAGAVAEEILDCDELCGNAFAGLTSMTVGISRCISRPEKHFVIGMVERAGSSITIWQS